MIPTIKRLVIVSAAAGFVLSNAASAQQTQQYPPRRHRHSRIVHVGSPTDQKYGIGFQLGEPTGISGKMWLNPVHAVDAALAYSFNSFFLIYSDYLFHFPLAFGHQTEFVAELTPYVGVGGMFLFQSGTGALSRAYFNYTQGSVGLALRVPLGIEWRPQGAPLGVFAELAPGLGIIPTTFGVIQAVIGARYYF